MCMDSSCCILGLKKQLNFVFQGFFRRIAKEKGSKPYRCSKSQNCVVTTGTRNLCRACRYQKCLDIGMSIEGK